MQRICECMQLDVGPSVPIATKATMLPPERWRRSALGLTAKKMCSCETARNWYHKRRVAQSDALRQSHGELRCRLLQRSSSLANILCFSVACAHRFLIKKSGRLRGFRFALLAETSHWVVTPQQIYFKLCVKTKDSLKAECVVASKRRRLSRAKRKRDKVPRARPSDVFASMAGSLASACAAVRIQRFLSMLSLRCFVRSKTLFVLCVWCK